VPYNKNPVFQRDGIKSHSRSNLYKIKINKKAAIAPGTTKFIIPGGNKEPNTSLTNNGKNIQIVPLSFKKSNNASNNSFLPLFNPKK